MDMSFIGLADFSELNSRKPPSIARQLAEATRELLTAKRQRLTQIALLDARIQELEEKCEHLANSIFDGFEHRPADRWAPQPNFPERWGRDHEPISLDPIEVGGSK
jgi:hypothetical protein